jgi:zinc D-Ala-D-Ala carboxypeptidase
MENISAHITFAEATKSQTAIRNGIDNCPDADTLERMKLVAESCFEPCRNYFNVPIGISSFYRCPALNSLVNGSSSSQHVKGEAIDIDAHTWGALTNAEIFNYIKDNLEFDQLIWEFGSESEPDWVHVSYKNGGNRMQILRSLTVNGKTVYQSFE